MTQKKISNEVLSVASISFFHSRFITYIYAKATKHVWLSSIFWVVTKAVGSFKSNMSICKHRMSLTTPKCYTYISIDRIPSNNNQFQYHAQFVISNYSFTMAEYQICSYFLRERCLEALWEQYIEIVSRCLTPKGRVAYTIDKCKEALLFSWRIYLKWVLYFHFEWFSLCCSDHFWPIKASEFFRSKSLDPTDEINIRSYFRVIKESDTSTETQRMAIWCSFVIFVYMWPKDNDSSCAQSIK